MKVSDPELKEGRQEKRKRQTGGEKKIELKFLCYSLIYILCLLL